MLQRAFPVWRYFHTSKARCNTPLNSALGVNLEVIALEILATSTITVALVAAALWLSRTWIVARLTADIRLENDSKLEALRSDLRKANETLSNVTAAGDRAFSQSQVALLPHKIKAIEQVWASVIAWNEMSAASMFVSVLPMDWVEEYGSHPSTKENFETLLKAPNHLESLKARSDTEMMRPFLSERGWALYSAYSGFYISRVTKASMFLFPTMDHAEVWARLSERSLVVASAPKEIVDRYDANCIDGTNAFLKYLKDEMVSEFRAELSGARDSASAISNSGEILQAAENLIQNAAKRPDAPGDSPLEHPE